MYKYSVLLIFILLISACKPSVQSKFIALNVEEKQAVFEPPICKINSCPLVTIDTLYTSDTWLNQWVIDQQNRLIQAQIGMNDPFALKESIARYVKASDDWQRGSATHLGYELNIHSHVLAQQGSYVLLAFGLDSRQKNKIVQDRRYFFVVDLAKKTRIQLIELLNNQQEKIMNQWVQKGYQTWLQQQPLAIRKSAPQQLKWQEGDWFFDRVGLGLHFHVGRIVANSPQFDFYLSSEQTQQVLKPQFYQPLFAR